MTERFDTARDILASRAALGGATSGKRERILLLAPHGAIFQGLRQAMQTAFPSLDVQLADASPAAGPADEAVRLVLLDPDLGNDLEESVTACRSHFPRAAIALVASEATFARPGLHEILERRMIHGMVPLSFKLHTFFAAVQLLLDGGECFPRALVGRAPVSRPREQVPVIVQDAASQSAHPGEAVRIRGLTQRERQVLELVSEGCQNKLIADRMALSEHTVKVHVRNLIKKLGVHNRTQVAMAFRKAQYPGAVSSNGAH